METENLTWSMKSVGDEIALREYIEDVCGFKHIHTGKVRDTYRIDPYTLLVVASDRISIFDFVLSSRIPYKGVVLTALTHFWTQLLTKQFPGEFLHHLIPGFRNPLFNSAVDLKERFRMLPVERCLVIRDLTNLIDPYELIFRHHLGGSIYRDYQKTGLVSGQVIEEKNLPEWSYLTTPIFSPSTKEKNGHDKNISAPDYYDDKQIGLKGKIFADFLKKVYSFAYEYAKDKELLILDTKFEGSSELCMVGDEILTPDSSRFVAEKNWHEHMNNPNIKLEFFDKQVVRNWGKNIPVEFQINGIDIQKLDPKNIEHRRFVAEQTIPSDIIEKTIRNYLDLFHRLTGMNIVQYLNTMMGIKLNIIPL